MTNRRKFIKQMSLMGVVGSMPTVLFSQQKESWIMPDSKSATDDDSLYVGWAVADITPDRPVALIGQFHKRISESVQDPLHATVLALETKSVNGRKEQAIMVSCDLTFIREQTQKKTSKHDREKIGWF